MVVERRIITDQDLNTTVDTANIVVSDAVRKEIEEGYINAGTIVIKDGKVFFHDPKWIAFSGNDTYEINLNAGYIEIKPPDGTAKIPVYVPINLEPLALLRQKVGWQPTPQ